MREKKLLFKIKTLEKLVFRKLIHDCYNEFGEKANTLTPTQMQIIEYIVFKSNGREVFQKDLEEVLGLRRATVSGVLQTMEKNGLIERISVSNDARVKKIILNPKAKKIFENCEKEIEIIESTIIKNISKEELEIFSNVLDKMKLNIEKENNKVAKRKESV